MLGLILVDLARSKGKLKPIFFSNLILSALNAVLVNIFSLFFNLNLALSSNLNQVVFNYTIINDFFYFLMFVIFQAIILAILSNVIFIVYYIEKRSKDIAVMKATGISQTALLQYFSLPPAIATLSSFLIGSAATYITMDIIWPGIFNGSTIALVFFLILLLGNLMSLIFTPSEKIKTMYKNNVVHILNHDFNRDYLELRKKSKFRSFLAKFGKTTLYSYKNLLTRKRDFGRSLIILTCTCLVSGLLFTSGAVIQSTYNNHISAALGGQSWQNVIVLGHDGIVDFVEEAYKAFYLPEINPVYDSRMYSNEFNMNTTSFNVSAFSTDIVNYDWRIIYNATVHEIQGHEVVPPFNQYRTWGRDRYCNAILQGINLSTSFNSIANDSGLSFGNDGNRVILGDSVAGLIIENMIYQQVGISNGSFNIAGQVFEPMNNGLAIYMNINLLRSILNKTSEYHNCLFITTRAMTDQERTAFLPVLDDYVKSTYGSNFTARSMKEIFSAVIQSPSNLMWFHVMLAIIVLAFSISFQLEFVKITIRSNSRDYSIMHAIGLSNRRIGSMIQVEFTLVLLIATILAFSLSLIVSSIFLIIGPTLPPIYLPIFIFSGIALLLAASNRILVHIIMKAAISY